MSQEEKGVKCLHRLSIECRQGHEGNTFECHREKGHSGFHQCLMVRNHRVEFEKANMDAYNGEFCTLRWKSRRRKGEGSNTKHLTNLSQQ